MARDVDARDVEGLKLGGKLGVAAYMSPTVSPVSLWNNLEVLFFTLERLLGSFDNLECVQESIRHR